MKHKTDSMPITKRFIRAKPRPIGRAFLLGTQATDADAENNHYRMRFRAAFHSALKIDQESGPWPQQRPARQLPKRGLSAVARQARAINPDHLFS